MGPGTNPPPPGAANVDLRTDSFSPALDAPRPVGAANVGVRNDPFPPALDPPSRFPPAGVQCSRCGTYLTYYDTEHNFSARRTDSVCIRCSGGGQPSSPPLGMPPFPGTSYHPMNMPGWNSSGPPPPGGFAQMPYPNAMHMAPYPSQPHFPPGPSPYAGGPGVYAGPFGPYPNHVPGPALGTDGRYGRNGGQDRDEGCGCVIL